MNRLKTIGLALALLALGALAASSASAAVEGILPVTTTGAGTGGVVKLETADKETIVCTNISILEIKFTTDEKGTATIHLTGCKAESIVPANSLGDASEVILFKVNLLICLIEPTTLVFGILLEPVNAKGEPITEHIEIPAIGALLLLKGAVIAKSESVNKGKEFKYSLKGKGGVQSEPTECTILGKTFKHSLEAVNDNKPKDLPASLEAQFTIKFNVETAFEDES